MKVLINKRVELQNDMKNMFNEYGYTYSNEGISMFINKRLYGLPMTNGKER